MDTTTWKLLVVISTGLLWFLLKWSQSARSDQKSTKLKQPLVINPSIPYIGHVLGMVKDGSKYYANISASCTAPIYSLPVPKNQIYIVKSLALAKAVDRNSKTLSFAPYVYEFAKRILQPSPEGLDALKNNMDGAQGQWGCCIETLQAMHTSMAPGELLDSMSRSFANSVCRLLKDDIWRTDSESPIHLFASMRRLIGRSSTDTLYGSGLNPFADPEVEAGFWAVDAGFGLLGLNVLPQIFAPKAYYGRQKVFKAFRKYYASDWRANASPLIKARYAVNQKFISQEDTEHFDLSVLIGLLVNTVPATAWVLYYIYSNEEFLDQLRETCLTVSQLSLTTSEKQSRSLRISEVLRVFPQLEALVQETLRIQSTNASGRIVLEDTTLDGTYLLKKNSFVLIPSAELHHDTDAWGPDHNQFSIQRFMAAGSATKHSHSAFRAFGGGSNMCPGRFLAMNEIATVAVICTLKYNMTPISGEWAMPRRRPHITTSILTPVEDIPVKVVERRGDFDFAIWDICW